MKIVRWWFAVALALSLVPASAFAFETIDPYTLEQVGGTYLSDCKNSQSPRVTVKDNALIFTRGDKRVSSTGNVMATATYFGQDPPAEFVTALIGELKDGQEQFIFIVDKDKAGLYITLLGDEAVLKQVGPDWKSLKFRKCDAPAKSADATTNPTVKVPPKTGAQPVPVEPAGVSSALPGPAEMLEDPAFKKAYLKALGKFSKEDWLTTLEGPAPDTRKVTVAGEEYVLLQACKIHDCAENTLTVLYSDAKKLVYGKVRMAGKSTMLGNPPPPVAREIGEFWRKQWVSQP